jgi:hypothetical protein
MAIKDKNQQKIREFLKQIGLNQQKKFGKI